MPGFNLAKWFIEGEVDWDYWNEKLGQWGPVLAGALFGAGVPPSSLPPPGHTASGTTLDTSWRI